MADVDLDDVTALLDRDTPAVEQAVAVITNMARAYTRGRGFDDGEGGDEPNAEIAAVITTASARLATNGAQALFRKKVDDVEYEWRSAFNGWTLAELVVLNRYRVTAM